MINVAKLAQFARMLEKLVDFLQKKGGLPPDAKIESVDWSPSGPILHMDDGTHWKVALTIEQIEGVPTKEDYTT